MSCQISALFVHLLTTVCISRKKKEKLFFLCLFTLMIWQLVAPMAIVSFKELLGNDFEITDLGELKFMLGILITRDRHNRLIYLNQSAYISQILTRFGLQDAIPVSTPLLVKHNLCYESPREERVSHVFKYLISNIKLYNEVKI